MNTPSQLPHLHTCTRLGRYILALLIGATLALSGLLPSAALARTQGQASVLAADPNYLVDKGGVSVVRLEVTYSNSFNPQDGEVTCTGLGVLVGSVPQQDGTFQNWVLTDASLLSSNIVTCELPSANTVEIRVFVSNGYTQDSFVLITLGQIFCTLERNFPARCHGYNTANPAEALPVGDQAQAILLSFQTTVAQPYLSLAPATDANPTVLGLTDVYKQAFPGVQVALSGPSDILNYLTPTVIMPTGRNASNLPSNIEPGTPLVNTSGKLEGMYQSDGTILPLDAIVSAVTSLIPASQSDLKTLWDQGVDAYNRGTQASCQLAQTDFQQITPRNGSFGAPLIFAMRAQTCAPPKLSVSSQSNTFLLLLLISLVVSLLLLVLPILLVKQMNKRRRVLAQFAIEGTDVQRLMEIDPAKVESTITEKACPRCSHLVKAGTIDCPLCGMRLGIVPDEPQEQAGPVAEKRSDSPIALPSQEKAVESVTGDAYRETRLRHLWDRVGQ